MSLETAAIAAYRGDWTEQARAALIDLLGDPDGTVSALDSVDLRVGTSTLVVFVTTEGNHLGVTIGGDNPGTWLVEADADKWVKTSAQIRDLAHLGEILSSMPTDPAWEVGLAVAVGERYTYGGLTYEVVQAHTTQADWTPDVTPALWTQVA